METTPDPLDLVFSALADPTRRAMLSRLSLGEATVSELAAPFLGRMSLPAITKHLQVLERAGLITKSRDAQWRHCKLNPATMRNASAWLESYRAFWEDRFDALDAFLKKTAPTQASTSQPEPMLKGTAHVPKPRKK